MVLAVVLLGGTTPPAALGTLLVLVTLGMVFVLRDRAAPGWASILALGVVVRLPYATFVPIHDDSLHYVESAQQLLSGIVFVDGHVGVAGVMAVFILVFGDIGPNLASFVAAITTIPVVGLTAAELFDSRRPGLAAGLAVALTPIHINFSSWAYTEPIALLFFATALYLLVGRRYVLAALVGGLVAIMRIEYLVLIIIPYVLIQHSRERWQPVVPAILAYVGVIMATIVGMAFSWRTVSDALFFVKSVPGVTRGTFVRFAHEPVEHLTRDILYYVPHFLHWGVPYWHLELVNPFLPVLFLVGVAVTSRRYKHSGLILSSAFVLVWILFVYKEVFVEPSQFGHVGLVFLAISFVTFGVFIYAGYEMYTPSHDLLWSTAPYLCLLVLLPLAPRYLLPLLVIYAMYVGAGLVWVAEDGIQKLTEKLPW